MSDSHEPAQKTTPEKIGAVVGAVIGGYFGPVGAGIGAFAGLTIAGAYLGSYESTPSRAPHSQNRPAHESERTSDSSQPKESPYTNAVECPNCAKKNPAGALLCMYCGGRLPDAEDNDV